MERKRGRSARQEAGEEEEEQEEEEEEEERKRCGEGVTYAYAERNCLASSPPEINGRISGGESWPCVREISK
jgi:hypothetical protein